MRHDVVIATSLPEAEKLLAAPASARHAVVAVFPGLRDRQAEVVELAARGLDTKAVAQIMGVGERTVETYWRRIFARTGRHGRDEVLAAVRAAAVYRPSS
jgi:DNA-binding CsgD family transcriptional regulator